MDRISTWSFESEGFHAYYYVLRNNYQGMSTCRGHQLILVLVRNKSAGELMASWLANLKSGKRMDAALHNKTEGDPPMMSKCIPRSTSLPTSSTETQLVGLSSPQNTNWITAANTLLLALNRADSQPYLNVLWSLYYVTTVCSVVVAYRPRHLTGGGDKQNYTYLLLLYVF